jgi:hypothetical protein
VRRDFLLALPTFTTSLSSLDRAVTKAGFTVEVMNTLLDFLESNGERLSPHIDKSDRGWWVAGIAVATVIALWFVLAALAGATPSTIYWAPATASCQAGGAQ